MHQNSRQQPERLAGFAKKTSSSSQCFVACLFDGTFFFWQELADYPGLERLRREYEKLHQQLKSAQKNELELKAK